MADAKLATLKTMATIAPKKSALILQPWPMAADYKDFLTVSGQADGKPAWVMYGLGVASHTVLATLDIKSWDMATDVKFAIYEAAPGAIEGLDTDDKKKSAKNIVDIYNAAIGWIVELSACDQVKELSESNVENYLRMVKTDLSVSRLLAAVRYTSRKSPDLIAALPDSAKDTEFVKYHTTLASGVGLIHRYLQALPGVIMAKWSDDERNAVAAYMRAPNEMKLLRVIPTALYVHSYIFHEMAGTLPARWFQANRAIQNTAVQKITALRAFYKKMILLAGNTTAIDGAVDMTALAALFNK